LDKPTEIDEKMKGVLDYSRGKDIVPSFYRQIFPKEKVQESTSTIHLEGGIIMKTNKLER
jgi:hypothetical protein